jgi:hypothetical protein
MSAIPYIFAALFLITLLSLAIAPGVLKKTEWAKCHCGLFHNTRTGRVSFDVPADCDGVVVYRSCEDCVREDFSAETITGSNGRKGSEMPAERNGDCLSRLTDARHACAGNFNNKAAR